MLETNAEGEPDCAEFDYHEPQTPDEASRLLARAGRRDLRPGRRHRPSRRNPRAAAGRPQPRQHQASAGPVGDRVRPRRTALRRAGDGGGARARARAGAPFPNLRAAVQTLGSIQVRNRATVVGNICRASPSADTIPPLMADGAAIETCHPEGAMSPVLRGPGDPPGPETPSPRCRRAAAPAPTSSTVAARRWSSPPSASPSASTPRPAAAPAPASPSARSDRRSCARRAPRRSSSARGSTRARSPTAAAQAARECTPISNVRSSADYRRDMVDVLTRRAVFLALETAA